MNTRHKPVLLEDVCSLFAENLEQGENNCFVLDGTLGGGGHTEELLKRFPDLFICGVDQDSAAIKRCEERLKSFSNRCSLQESSFFKLTEESDLGEFFQVEGLCEHGLSGVLIDLGLSSDQLDDADRGFSFRNDGPLDMRMSRSQELTAEKVLNSYSEHKLTGVFKRGGVGSISRILAKEVVSSRPLERTFDFKKVCKKVVLGRDIWKSKDPCSLPFQAVRIEVNNELRGLKEFLADLPGMLGERALVVVISFHSLEDKVVANIFRSWEQGVTPTRNNPERLNSLGEHLTRKAMMAGDEECEVNSRARSARMRAFLYRK